MEHILKQNPEDFVVKELFEPKLGEGRYACYILWKRSYTTQKAVLTLSRRLHMKPKYFNTSGNKDKYAVTEQYMTISHGPKHDVEMNDIRLRYLGQTDERMNLGTASGNHFILTVRGLSSDREPAPPKSFPNYFDEQRFGNNLNNHHVGRLLIKKDFEGACRLIPEVQEALARFPTDYVGALRSLPKGVLRIYANSFQSWLWNETVSLYLSRFPHVEIKYPLGKLCVPTGEVGNLEVPIVGHDTKPEDIPEPLQHITENILALQQVYLRDFSVPQIPELDLSGDKRQMLVEPKDLHIGQMEDDDLNPGKRKMQVSFSLPNGSYATMLVRCLFS